LIGISLLTLDPWTVGGTQTHARELVRALARHGTLDYRVYVSDIAPEAGGDLRTVVVPEFPAGRSRLGRVAGLTLATIADGRLRRRLDRDHAAAFHFPLTVMLPPRLCAATPKVKLPEWPRTSAGPSALVGAACAPGGWEPRTDRWRHSRSAW